jgi:hypothetical protein
MLTVEQVERYRHDGYLFPLPALSTDEVAECRAGLARFEHWLGTPLTDADRKWRSAGYIIMPWVDGLVRHEKILDAVESLIGPDILVYTSTFFIKEPNSPVFAAWYQDATYFGLTPHQHVTAWVALSDATSIAGCMEVASSRGAPRQLRHAALGLANSINGGGQAIIEDFDQDGVVANGIAGRQLLAASHAVPAPLGAQPGITPAGRAGHQLYPGASPHDRLLSVVGAARQRARHWQPFRSAAIP